MEIFFPEGMPEPCRGKTNKACSGFKKLNVAPDEIKIRYARYREMWPGIACNPMALLSNWHEFSAENRKPKQSTSPQNRVDRKAINAEYQRIEYENDACAKILCSLSDDEFRWHIVDAVHRTPMLAYLLTHSRDSPFAQSAVLDSIAAGRVAPVDNSESERME
jgi:hypothetical protein